MDINQIRNMLRINRHRVDEELELQPEIAESIGRECARLSARVTSLADELKRIEGRRYLELREQGEKMTEKEIDHTVRRDRDRMAAFEKHTHAVHDLAEWEALRDAWTQRSYALSKIAELWSSEFSATMSRSVIGGDPEAQRTAMRQLLRQASDDQREGQGRVRVRARS